MLQRKETVEGSVTEKASRHMLQASSQASWIPPSTKAAAEHSNVPQPHTLCSRPYRIPIKQQFEHDGIPIHISNHDLNINKILKKKKKKDDRNEREDLFTCMKK